MYRQAPAPPPKPPRSSLQIALIIAAVVVGVLIVGTGIVMSAIDTKSALKELTSLEAGPPMTEEEVRAALAGPKKDFVGHWSTVTGNGVLNIEADGRIGYAAQRGMARENANGRIESFTDDAFYVMMFRFPIEKPPERVAGKWVMKVRGHTWERD